MKSVRNGAGKKIMAALERGPQTIDELATATGLSRKQIIQNTGYLRKLGMCERKWCIAGAGNA